MSFLLRCVLLGAAACAALLSPASAQAQDIERRVVIRPVRPDAALQATPGQPPSSHFVRPPGMGYAEPPVWETAPQAGPWRELPSDRPEIEVEPLPPSGGSGEAPVPVRSVRTGMPGHVLPGDDPARLRRRADEEGWDGCALTFDDGPGEATEALLAVLEREGVPAAYFPVAKNVPTRLDLVRRFARAGIEIGSHSVTHGDMRRMNEAQQDWEIAESLDALRAAGVEPRFFRPPYGAYTEDLLRIASWHDVTTVLWSVDSRDWKLRDADRIRASVALAAGPGDVVLLHATVPETVEALPGIIADLRAKGCRFVPLSEWVARMREGPVG